MTTLRIARGFALPVDVAGEAIAILAKRGAGKTNTATVLVEELHAAGVQTVVVDPVGAWWGLRYGGAGAKAAGGLPVPILGGQHGDVPLEQAAGALIADVVVDSGQSLVLDLSDFPSKAAIARFVADFAERLYHRKARERSLLHLVLEEADAFAPQRTFKGGERMLGAIESIVRRGRGRGLGTTLITQRSAVLNKNVLEQADVLIVLRTTGPNDRKAIESWIEQHADDGADQVLPSLPSLETGEAWVWNPQRGILQRVRIRHRHTFDSSETPKAGERRAEPRQAAPIDLDTLGQQIQATAERAKADDPAELRKRIRELERKLASEPTTATVEERVVETVVEVPVVEAELVERLERAIESVTELQLAFVSDLGQRVNAVRDTAGEITFQLRRIANQPAARAKQVERREEASSAGPVQTRPPARRPAPPAPPTPVDGEFRPSGPQQRILNALAALETIGAHPADKTQLALFAEASPKSSSYSNNLGALRTAGLIDYPAGGLVALTAAGAAIADAHDAPQTVDELHAYVRDLVGAARWRLLEQLIAAEGAPFTKEELAELAGASPTSSSFTNNLGSLRSLKLIDYPQPGYVAARPVLFLEGTR